MGLPNRNESGFSSQVGADIPNAIALAFAGVDFVQVIGAVEDGASLGDHLHCAADALQVAAAEISGQLW